MMDLTISIVSWNTRDLLRGCLESIERSASEISYEVVVVDNNSSDGSAAMVEQEFPHVRLIANSANVGFATANNQAIDASSGRHVLLLNSDAELVRGSAEAMVAFLDMHPTVGAVGGQVRNPDGTFQSSYADFTGLVGETLLLTGLSRLLLPPTYPSVPENKSSQARSVDWVSGAFLMVRRQAIDSVGPLDTDYFLYTEEMDWCYRLKKGGWEVFYIPNAKAIHQSGGSSDRAPERKRSQLYHSKWLFMHKHRSRLEAGTYRFLVRVFSVMKLIAWQLTAFSHKGVQRERARQQVASYRLLLSSF